MGKVFITDEVNDSYTANVFSDGALQVTEAGGALSIKTIAGAAISTSAWAVSTPCYLHSILMTAAPATATTLTLVNASASAETTSTGSTGRVACIYVAPAACATSIGWTPQAIRFPYYFTKGMTYYLSAGDAASAGLHLLYRA